MRRLTRREFVLATLGTTGALSVGWSLSAPRRRLLPRHPLEVRPGETALNGWVKVSPDNTITVVMASVEMGQGAHTGLAMLLADEMDAAWEQVEVQQSSFDAMYNNQAAVIDSLPFLDGALKWSAERLVGNVLREVPGFIFTGGSSSIRDQCLPLRAAGASARAMLLAAAAAEWRVPAAECTAVAGRVSHVSGRGASFGELAARAGGMSVPRTVRLKTPAEFTLIGRPLPRLDAGTKIDGSAVYGIDFVPDGALHAAILMCPTVGGKAARIDAGAALALPGVRKVVIVPPVPGGVGGFGSTSGGVAVVADTHFQALRALRSVVVEWDHGAAGTASTEAIERALVRALNDANDSVHFERGDAAAALRAAAKTINAEYHVPFLAHATMEPMNCTVQYKDGSATVWAGTQAPGLARKAVAKVFGIAPSKVDVRVPFLGGGFGRRFLTDVVVQAAHLARDCGERPVHVLWSREEDTTHDFYRPAFASRATAGFDARGRLIAWRTTSAGSSMGSPSFLDQSTDGASHTAYAFPNARIAHVTVESPVTVGIWRSVNHSQNAFFTECFVDECAAAADCDPVAMRALLLRDNPRHLAVLRRAAQLSGWSRPAGSAPDGARMARGIAIHRSFGSIVGQVAEVSLEGDRDVRVHRVVCVVDCGLVVNPNLVRQQIEGSIVFGLSAALRSEITVAAGRVQQRNFNDGLALRMNECPAIDIDIVESAEPPGGVGECGVPPVAPAVANALFALTGRRFRRLPLRPA